jgi:hypothetical protein
MGTDSMRKVMTVAAIATLSAFVSAAPALAMMKEKNKGVATSAGELVLYDGVNYSGRDLYIDSARVNVTVPFNIKSIGVYPGERWKICAKPRFREPCLTVTESVPDASTLGIYGGIGSAQPIEE